MTKLNAMLKRSSLAAVVLFSCSSDQTGQLQESSIPPGLYFGDRSCTTRIYGEVDTSVESWSITINDDGLAVLNGETIHVGMIHMPESGVQGVIESIAVGVNGFSIGWILTVVINEITLSGSSNEFFRAIGPNALEVRTNTVLGAEGFIVILECVAVLSR